MVCSRQCIPVCSAASGLSTHAVCVCHAAHHDHSHGHGCGPQQTEAIPLQGPFGSAVLVALRERVFAPPVELTPDMVAAGAGEPAPHCVMLPCRPCRNPQQRCSPGPSSSASPFVSWRPSAGTLAPKQQTQHMCHQVLRRQAPQLTMLCACPAPPAAAASDTLQGERLAVVREAFAPFDAPARSLAQVRGATRRICRKGGGGRQHRQLLTRSQAAQQRS